MGGLQVDAFVAGVGGDDDLELASHEGPAHLVALGLALPSGVETGGEPLGFEAPGDPLGRVRVLREHHGLLAVAGENAVLGQTVLGQPLPLRRRPRRVTDRGVDLVREVLDRRPLGSRGRRARVDDLGLVDLRLVTLALAVGDEGRFGLAHGAHVVVAPPERLGERIQTGRRPLAVDHAGERLGRRREVPVDHVQRSLVEAVLGLRQGNAVVVGGTALEKARLAVVIDQVFLHPSQEVDRARPERAELDVGIATRVRVDLRVDQMQKMPEEPLLAPMRGRGHQQGPRGVLGQQAANLMEPGRSRGQPVCLVEDHQVPAGLVRPNSVLHSRVDRGQLQGGHPQVVGVQRVLTDGRRGELPQPAAQQPLEVVHPLRGQVRRAHDDGALDQAQPLHLPDIETGHDRLAGARLVGEQEAQQRLRQHRAVHGRGLVGIRLQRRGRHGTRLCVRGRRVHPLGPHGGQHPGRVGSAITDQRAHGLGVSGRQVHLVPTVLVVDKDEIPRTRLVARKGKADGSELGHSGGPDSHSLSAFEHHLVVRLHAHARVP